MVSLHKLGFVLLMCGSVTFCDTVTTTTNSKGEGTSQETGSDFRLSCDGKTYNPLKDTCCKVQDQNITENLTKGLSERMSLCCGLQAYHPLNEICCNLTVKPKPSLDAKCCGKEPYDEKEKLCCGGKKLLTKLSPHHLCCYESQFDPFIENCCQNMCPRIQLKSNNFDSCEKKLSCNLNLSGQHQGSQCVGNKQCCGTIALEDKEVCCETETESVVYHKREGFECCGHHYYNSSLWLCNATKLEGKHKPRHSDNGSKL
ncbi:uncharacterized protein FYW61_001318 isoform 2-T2 [Anableps anableps]